MKHAVIRILLFYVFLAELFATPVSETRVSKGIEYQVVTVLPQELELFWRAPGGKPYRQFRAVQQEVERRGRRLAFITNGGIFEPDGTPSGLVVISGKQLREANTADAQGNFFLKPNGVFFVAKNRAGILSTDDYLAARPTPDLALQSGPLLLRKGQVHPAFREDSTNRLHRSGIGVNKQGKVVFVITRFEHPRRPNLFEFAVFFRSLGCDDALFLDGDISDLQVSPATALPRGNHFGAIFAVTAPR